MYFRIHKIFKSIVTIGLVAMLFSCTNDVKAVKEFLSTKHLPIAVTNEFAHTYRDSGKTTSKLFSPLLKDFSNREVHPYSEFPKGLKLISFDTAKKDSTTTVADYAISFSKTLITELRGNVVITNHKDQTTLYTDQLFWDQNTDYFFSEKKFRLLSPDNDVSGIGFESKKDLSKFLAKKTSSEHLLNED